MAAAVHGQPASEEKKAPANPYWPMANLSCARVLKLPDDQLIKEAASNVFWLAWGSTASQSEIQEKPQALEKCVRLWDVIAAATGKDNPKSNGWNLLPLLESLRFLKLAHAVAPAKLAGWEAALRPAVEDALKEYGGASTRDWATSAAKQYPNADAQHAAIMYAAYLIYPEEKFKENASEFVRAMETQLRPPGAWLYYKGSTPIPLYHGFEIIFLGRYYQLSKDPLAADQIRRTVDFYPTTYAPENTVEFSSSPWWKQIWNPTGGPYHAPEMVAWLTADPHNRWFADLRSKQYFPYYWVVYCAEAWEASRASNVRPEPFPDGFIVGDPSIDGLRGRYGNFSFVGSRGRNVMSFGGCLVADEKLPSGYDGYLQFCHIGIEVPGKEGRPYYDALRLVADPQNTPTTGAQVIGKDFAALAVSYVPRLQTRPETGYDDWQVQEIWLFTPHAVVATLRVTSLKDNPQTLPKGLIRLGPLNRPHGLEKKSFFLGSLHGLILHSDFNGIEMRDGSPDQNGHESRVEIGLSIDPPPALISKGQHWQYSVLYSPEKGGLGSGQFNPDGSQTFTIGGVDYRLAYDGASGLRAEKPAPENHP